MEYHKLLQMQLKKCHLRDDSIPGDLTSWQSFIECINKSYVNDENDRYLLERSMQLSSSEMKELNGMLENAQKIARMGYWNYDPCTNDITWSKQAYYLFGIDNIVNMDMFYALVEEKDRHLFQEKVETSLLDNNEFECEVQIKNERKNKFVWYRIIGKPIIDQSKNKKVCLNFVSIDISLKKAAGNELSHLNTQLVISARRAGMADVATAVLHNVGNILNSANVSVNLIHENIHDQSIHKLMTIKELMAANIDHIVDYISSDEKGKLIPKYFIALASKVTELHESIISEIDNLKIQIQHIRDITDMQKDIGGISDMNESLFVNDLLDTAIMMCDPSIESKSIKIVKHYHENIFINSDRSKILQILVNLIQNAKESLLSLNDQREKTIVLSCEKLNAEQIKISVQDNGIGMSEDTLKKIYTFGFTTKKTGHGFGMHSSSLTARELNGELIGISAGTNQGATFTLILPVQKQLKQEVNYESKHEFENHHH